MSKKIISFGLSENEIDAVIRELETYKQSIVEKTELLRKRVAELLEAEAQSGFNGAIVDDIVNGEKRTAQVSVSVSHGGDISLVIANGEDAVWVEFGAGVYHNGSAGSSPHPKGAELGMTIGSFGKGHGKRQTWGFYEDGELRLTHGTPARMPMARAVTAVCNDIQAIAQEVFR